MRAFESSYGECQLLWVVTIDMIQPGPTGRGWMGELPTFSNFGHIHISLSTPAEQSGVLSKYQVHFKRKCLDFLGISVIHVLKQTVSFQKVLLTYYYHRIDINKPAVQTAGADPSRSKSTDRQNHPISKMVVPFEPKILFWCPSGFRTVSITMISFITGRAISNHLCVGAA